MAPDDVFARIQRYYDNLVESFGHDPRAADYGHPASQAKKYRVLADVAPLTGRSVLDVGCGFGDFGAYLQERYGMVDYNGIDLSERMIQAARAAHPGFELRRANILDLSPETTYDVVTANGIFYLLGVDAENTMRRIIERMFTGAREAVAFNSLSALAHHKEPGEFYADPGATLTFCQTLTPRVILRHDYHSRDFTVYMYRSEQE